MQNLFKEKTAKLIAFIFLVLTLMWVYLTLFQKTGSIWHNVFTNVYGFVALIGGIAGVLASKRWGGFKSLIGRAILFFSFGLFSQEFGQLSYNFYIYVLKVKVPYPSIGDIGFLGYVPLYLYAMFCLSQAIGLRVSLRKTWAKVFAIITPIVVLIITAWIFLSGYQFDWSKPLVVFLDLAYPLVQSFSISALVVVYVLTNKYMGGIMRGKVLFLLFAYMMQYVSDFTFLYQVNRGAWVVGGVNDYMYLVSYFLMTIGLIQLKTVHDNLTNTANK